MWVGEVLSVFVACFYASQDGGDEPVPPEIILNAERRASAKHRKAQRGVARTRVMTTAATSA